MPVAAKAKDVIEFKPQAGPQTDFMRSPADIVVFGGSAGGGKTFAELLEPLRHINKPNFGAIIFRRTYPEITNMGGLWDTSKKIYPYLRAKSYSGSDRKWVFPSGAEIGFKNLPNEDALHNYQGSQIPLIQFDELTHFTEQMFTYMLSRSRNASAGVRSYVRATTNPEGPDHWVTRMIDWWIGEDGFIIPERSGKLRWFVRWQEELHWADEPETLKEKFPDIDPKSFTFIRSTVYDNQILLDGDPGYLANLQSLSRIDRMRLLEGNWLVSPQAGMIFNRTWFKLIDINQLPFDLKNLPRGAELVRFWDLAATEKDVTQARGKEPCYTVGTKMLRMPTGDIYVLDVIREQASPGRTNELMRQTATLDGYGCKVRWEQEPGSAGKRDAAYIRDNLKGYDAQAVAPQGDKVTRAKPFSAAAEQGRVFVVMASWTDPYLAELHSIPDGKFFDQCDSSSGAFNVLNDRIVSQRPRPMFVTTTMRGY